MSDESGRWGPYRSINRKSNVSAVLKMLGQACEAAMANGFDLMPGIITPELLDAIDHLNGVLRVEAPKIAAALSKPQGPQLVKEEKGA